jgi:uncharacterized protein YicC (UPF0701 family)
MKPETSPDTLAIPPALLAELQAEAEKEHRPAAELLRDLVQQGLAERREWQAHAERERQRAIDLGIHDPADDEPMTDEYRQDIREKIAQGLKSLREGRFTDGETFMAKMDAELAELERQGR